jgi:predicted RNA methylase
MPPSVRALSGQFWTPLAVALRVAEWMDALEVETVVDVGSGAGKLCVAAALASKARYHGVEHRAHLVGAARALARTLEVDDRATFELRTVGDTPPPEAQAYYLYNPFGENRFDRFERIDADVELGEARFRRDVTAVERWLRAAPKGTLVVTYNGFGGTMPSTFEELRVDRVSPLPLRMWRKTARRIFRLPSWTTD